MKSTQTATSKPSGERYSFEDFWRDVDLGFLALRETIYRREYAVERRDFAEHVDVGGEA